MSSERADRSEPIGASRRPRVVLTGASGFIGRRLTDALLAADYEVTALARDRSRIPPRTGALGVVDWDAERGAPPLACLEGADAVCHAAAFIPPDPDDPAYAESCLRINALGTLWLAEAAARAGVARFVSLSSGQMYAAHLTTAAEGDPTDPSRHAPFYFASKLSGEAFARATGVRHGMKVAILRLASVYGPGMGSHGLVPVFAARLRASEAIDVRDAGRHRVDLVHIDDVISALLSALSSQASGIFNVGSGDATTALDVADTLVRLLGSDADLVRLRPPSSETATPGFPALDITRARDEWGYRPRQLSVGLRDYLESLTT